MLRNIIRIGNDKTIMPLSAKVAGGAMKRVPTGGGPPPPSPMAAQSIWLKNHDSSTTITGISGLIDSALQEGGKPCQPIESVL